MRFRAGQGSIEFFDMQWLGEANAARVPIAPSNGHELKLERRELEENRFADTQDGEPDYTRTALGQVFNPHGNSLAVYPGFTVLYGGNPGRTAGEFRSGVGFIGLIPQSDAPVLAPLHFCFDCGAAVE